MRKFGIGVAALLALLVGTALIGPNLVDWNSYKADILSQVKSATGRDLAIDGNIGFSVLPGLQLTAGNVRVANIEGGSSADMMRLKSLDLKVRLLPLLQGRIEAEAITLLEPDIRLERLPDGRVNWDFTASGDTASQANKVGATTGSSVANNLLTGVRLDNVLIRRGTVVYRDAVAGVEERVAGMTLQVGVRSLNGPFRAKGDVILRGVPVSLDAAIGVLKPTDPAPVNFQVTVPSAGTRLEVNGGAVVTGAAPRFTGKLTVSGNDMRRLSAAISGRSRNSLPAALAQPFLLKARLKGTEKGGTIEDIDVELGGARASGAVSFAAGERFRAAARVRLNRIDLDEWVKTARALPNDMDINKSGGSGTEDEPLASANVSAAAAEFELPGIDATLDARIDAVTYNRQNVRNIAVKASMAGGVLRLDQASVLLPGGGEATATGQLSARDGKPAYRGTVDSQADNLRAVLGWLGMDVSSVPASRLRKFAFSAAVNGDDQQIQIRETKISVDTTRIDGGVTVALRDRVAFGATINVDNLDLDAYTISSPASQKEGTNSAGTSERNAPRESENSTSERAPAASLAVLNDFDANIRFRVGRLTLRQTPIKDVRLNGTLLAGELKIRNASVGDIGGGSASVTGTLNNFSGVPVFKGTVLADAKDAEDIVRLAGIAPDTATRSLGALRLRGTAETSGEKLDLDLSVSVAGAKLNLSGAATNFNKSPKVDAVLTLDHRNLAQLVKNFGGDLSVRNLGPVNLSAKIQGATESLNTTARISAVGGVFESKGIVSNLFSSPEYDLEVAASHKSVGDLMQKFAPDYRPAGGDIGPLAIKADVKGSRSRYDLSSLSAKAGEVVLQGSGRLDLTASRPALTAEFQAGEINLNPFLPPSFGQQTRTAAPTPDGRQQVRANQIDRVQQSGRARNGAAVSGSETGQRFSSDPFDLTALGLIDATLSVGASALIYRQFRVDRPAIQGSLVDQKLTVSNISGKMYDGAFNLAGTLDGRRIPALDGKVTVSGANVGKAFFQAEQFDIQGGITDFSLQLAGLGTSPNAMIRSLEGTGVLNARDGVVKGFNLKAVSDRLKNLDNAIDFVSLFGTSMQGGQTRFSSLSGTFSVKKGIVRNDDLRLVAEAGEARAAGTADLPRWHMDFNGQFQLTEHPNAPPFLMRAVGPIDNPKRIFKFDRLQAFLLQRGIGTLLRKVFPDGRRPQSAPQQQQQPQPQEQQQPQPQEQKPTKPRLEDLIPGLLKGLGR